MQGVPPIRASFGVGSRQTDTLVHIDFGLSLRRLTCLGRFDWTDIKLSFGLVDVACEHVLLPLYLFHHVVKRLVPSSMVEEAVDFEHLTENCSVIVDQELFEHQVDYLLWDHVSLVLFLY